MRTNAPDGIGDPECYAKNNSSIGGDVVSNPCWSVYVHTNKINGKKYVGITSQNPKDRWLGGHGYGHKLKFGRAIEKYGWDGFEHEIVCEKIPEDEAKNMEQVLISNFSTQDDRYGYNMTSGGDGISGFKHTDESRRKMSISKSGSNHPNYHKHLSETTRTKIANQLVGNQNAFGVVRSATTRKRMSNSKKKPVEMYTNGVFVQRFDSATDAQLETGISRKNISLCCLGQRKLAGGYSWKFA